MLLKFLATVPLTMLLATQPRVVELGSGTGVVGLAAAALGGAVTLTDLPEVLPLLRQNIQQNASMVAGRGGSCIVAELSWGASAVAAELVSPGFVLMSDCIFETSTAVLLVQTLEQLCPTAATTILLANEQREHPKNREAEQMFCAAAAMLFTMDRVGSKEQDEEYCVEEIVVMRMRRRAV